MDTNLIPQRDAGCVEEVLEGEIVLYSACSAKALYLNEPASLVWQLIDGERSIAQMELLLTEAYPEAVTLKNDLSEAIEVLRKHGVIHL
jgi:Coenzyme PQQ synthesis protein D (PqqD)